MSTYKDLLLKALLDNGWEQSEINEEGIDWWGDEVWKIKSNKQQWGLELYLTFLVDPQWISHERRGREFGQSSRRKVFLKTGANNLIKLHNYV